MEIFVSSHSLAWRTWLSSYGFSYSENESNFNNIDIFIDPEYNLIKHLMSIDSRCVVVLSDETLIKNLGINDNNFDNNFIIYPNPSNGNINIKPLLDFGDAKVSIYDINGRKVYNTDVNLQNTVSINIQNLSAGMYIMQIEGADYSHTAKLIIN